MGRSQNLVQRLLTLGVQQYGTPARGGTRVGNCKCWGGCHEGTYSKRGRRQGRAVGYLGLASDWSTEHGWSSQPNDRSAAEERRCHRSQLLPHDPGLLCCPGEDPLPWSRGRCLSQVLASKC